MSNIVIGGGIAGLSMAYHFVKNGQDVTLIEEKTVGHQTSSKAAGMITPASEVHLGENKLVNCFLNCAEYYPSFVDDITKSQPNLVNYSQKGSFMCATDQDGQNELKRLKDFQNQMGLNVEEIEAKDFKKYEPNLSHRLTYAVFAKNEACIDNLKLIKQLKQVLLASGRCQIIENKAVTNMNFDGDRIKDITVGQKETITLTGQNYILTTGLEHGLKSLEDKFELPLRPVKGQVLILQGQPQTIQRPVRVYNRYPIYLVPRQDGRIVIGATSEELSDQTITAGGLLDLIYAAWLILPMVYDFPIVETKVGLRPATPDHKPIVGKTPISNLFTLTGLYRHGIMAAPYLAKELCHLILEKNTELEFEEFSWQRFKNL